MIKKLRPECLQDYRDKNRAATVETKNYIWDWRDLFFRIDTGPNQTTSEIAAEPNFF
jgi:DNA/RNA-binding domain of Phe-tRNA-synthetase-like protein